MTEKEKCELGLLYDANYDVELLKLRQSCKDLCHELNATMPSNTKKQKELIELIIGEIGEDFVITSPFWCDYGKNIHIGNNFYSNHNLIILDGAKVEIGNNVFIAPNCCISTATHPVDHVTRNKGLEFAKPIKICDNVWIGANVTIMPGVTIGENSVIGAGSVVTKDIVSNKIAFGNPCKERKDITKDVIN